VALSKPDWSGLQQGISGDVVLPGSEAYEWVRKPFIARFDEIKPEAVVRCAAPEDVAEVVAFARRYVPTRQRGAAAIAWPGTRRRAGSSST